MALCPKPYTFENDIASKTPTQISCVGDSRNGNTKRSCNFLYPSTPNKRICLQPILDNIRNTNDGGANDSHTSQFLLNRKVPSNYYYSSSSEDDDSEDEQTCYNADQARAKRRASTRVSFSNNLNLVKAMSKYSDDEDEDIRLDTFKPAFSVSRRILLDMQYNNSNNNNNNNNNNFNNNNNNNNNSHHHHHHHRSASASSIIKILKSEDEIENLDCKIASSPISSKLCLKKMLASSDFSDSVNDVIDREGNGNGNGNNDRDDDDGDGDDDDNVCNDDDDDDDDDEQDESDSVNHSVAIADRNARVRCFDYLIGAIDEAWARYCDATTYVEDEVHGYITPASLASDCSDDDDKELMNLKQRLIRSKEFLQDHIESHDMDDVRKFWHRWDVTKYQMLDVMEDDDDVLDELECGRRIF